MKTSPKDVIWNRRWLVLAVMVLFVLCGPLIWKLTLPSYSGEAEIAYVGKGEEAVLQPEDLPELALSSSVLRRAIRVGQLPLTIDEILKKVSVRQSPHSDIVPVDYRSSDEGLALAVPNAIADATIAEYKLLATRQYDEVVEKLNAQLAGLQSKIHYFDSRYQESVRNDPMAGVTTGLDALSAQLSTLDQTRAAAKAKLAQDAAAATGTSVDSSAPDVSSVVHEEALQHDPVLIALSNQHAKDLADYESVRGGYTDNFPGLAGLREKVSAEYQAVQRESSGAVIDRRGASPTFATLMVTQRTAENLVAADRGQLDALNAEYVDLRKRLDGLPRLTVPADDFRVQRDGATAAYTQIEAALRTALAQQAQAGSLNSVVLLNHAFQAKPNISPPVKVALILLLLLGLAIGSAYAAEYLDPRIRSRFDVENLYGSPLLGSI